MKRVMLDLETFSKKPNALILSIGACFFDPTGPTRIGDTFYRVVSLEDQQELFGRHVDPETAIWWSQQDGDARILLKDVININVANSIAESLSALSEWMETECGDPGPDEVWGNGSDFDNVILKSAYEELNFPLPWSYKANRCFRTLKKLFPHIEEPDFEGVRHNALDDAIHQARWASLILNSLG